MHPQIIIGQALLAFKAILEMVFAGFRRQWNPFGCVELVGTNDMAQAASAGRRRTRGKIMKTTIGTRLILAAAAAILVVSLSDDAWAGRRSDGPRHVSRADHHGIAHDRPTGHHHRVGRHVGPSVHHGARPARAGRLARLARLRRLARLHRLARYAAARPVYRPVPVTTCAPVVHTTSYTPVNYSPCTTYMSYPAYTAPVVVHPRPVVHRPVCRPRVYSGINITIRIR